MVPPPATSSNPQQIQQFLNSVLSQRGPSALPYVEDTKWLIRQHLVTLMSHFPSLEPKTSSFTHNDGRSANLLQVDGTIPMFYMSVTYNIPIIIWLMESYPRHAPCVYLNPTRDMIIKRPHSHVSPSGLVSIPYLQNWIYPSSNLVDLVHNLSATFARDPPLYSQRVPNPNPNPNPPPKPSGSINSSISSSYGSVGRPPVMQQPPRAQQYPASPYGRVRTQTEDAAEYKNNAVNKLVEMVHGNTTGMRKAREAEMEGLFSTQAVLRRREEDINRGLNEMQDEKESLEQQLQVVLMNTDILDSWVRDNKEKTKKWGDLDVDNAFECMDVLSKQILESAAADLAIEDAVYSLDKALQEGTVPFDQYLRNVRLLSREQFFQRATAAKVRAEQMQAQVASLTARIRQFIA
ncbi:hypothetical protein SLE2022_112060 [Rubroshorea leprosula]